MKRGIVLLAFGALAVVLLVTRPADGHGMLLDPPGRSSMWRYFPGSPANYNDNGINCGGFGVSFE